MTISATAQTRCSHDAPAKAAPMAKAIKPEYMGWRAKR